VRRPQPTRFQDEYTGKRSTKCSSPRSQQADWSARLSVMSQVSSLQPQFAVKRAEAPSFYLDKRCHSGPSCMGNKLIDWAKWLPSSASFSRKTISILLIGYGIYRFHKKLCLFRKHWQGIGKRRHGEPMKDMSWSTRRMTILGSFFLTTIQREISTLHIPNTVKKIPEPRCQEWWTMEYTTKMQLRSEHHHGLVPQTVHKMTMDLDRTT
jgi:hypothetical protein